MVVPASVHRFDVFLVALDPTLGSEIKKTRPCVVVSPDEMNAHLSTAIIAPLRKLATKGRDYPTRVACTFQGKTGKVVLNQIRMVDKVRLVKKLGVLSAGAGKRTSAVLGEMFGE